MTEEFSFDVDVDEESIKQLESVIDKEVIKIRERFDNGTETLEDLLYQYPHIVLKCELKNKEEVDLDVVERKYYERLAGRAKLQDTEINKLKNTIDRIKEYANNEIESATENIEDYIDDDREANKSLIGEIKEWREHWKDIIRIMNNEKTYMDW